MENIRFEIIEEDIRKYLSQYRDDENIKYREAMFVKYLREQKVLTKESLEILMCMYNDEDVKSDGIYTECYPSSCKMFYELPDFNSYLKQINNIDLSGICHILIPTISYYDGNKPIVPIGKIANDLKVVAYNFNISINNHDDAVSVVRNTIINYRICDELGIDEDISFKPFLIPFKMGREQSDKRLQAYVSIYGEEPVKIIKKTVSERMM